MHLESASGTSAWKEGGPQQADFREPGQREDFAVQQQILGIEPSHHFGENQGLTLG